MKINNFISFLFCLLSLNVFSQLSPQWSNLYFHLGQNGYADKMIVNDSGNVYVTGVWSKLDSAMSSYYTIMTVKYSPTGNILWTKDHFHGYPFVGAPCTDFMFDRIGQIVTCGWLEDHTYSGYKFLSLKYSPGGTLIYEKSFLPTGYISGQGSCMTIDPFNNTIIAGLVNDSSNSLDIGMVKLDATGNIIWSTSYDNFLHTEQIPYAIKSDSLGNLYLCGRTWEAVQNYDWIVQKYDSSGSLIWTDTFNGPGGNGPDMATDIVFDSSGFIYVSGFGNYPVHEIDAVLIKYDTSGNKIWVNHFDEGLQKWEEPQWIKYVNSRFYCAGRSLDVNNTNDYFIYSCDTDGNLCWIKSYDYSNHVDDYSNGFAIDHSSNCYLTGWTNSNGRDLWTLKTDSSGSVLWNYTLDNSSHVGDFGNDIVVDNNGNAYVTGSTYNGIDCMITMKFDLLTNIQSTSSENNFLTIFPDPSNGHFQIRLMPETKLERLLIMDELGKIVFQLDNIPETELSIDLSKYPKGIYLIHGISKDKKMENRIIIIQ
jgi:hypothetical protein